MMELTLDNSDSQYQIRGYQPGTLRINDMTFHQSVILTPRQLHHPWPPQDFEHLMAANFDLLLSLQPEIVIIGTGEQMRFCSPAWLMPFYTKKIGVECMTTAAACRTFNVLAAEGRNVAAGLIIL